MIFCVFSPFLSLFTFKYVVSLASGYWQQAFLREFYIFTYIKTQTDKYCIASCSLLARMVHLCQISLR